MDGIPTLQAFDTELAFLQERVYGNPFENINRIDPIREGGRTKWNDVLAAVQGIRPGTPMKQAIFRAFADKLRTRPADIPTGYAILTEMRATVAAAMDVLRLHGKGCADTPDGTYPDSCSWVKPAMEDITLSDVRVLGSGNHEGQAVRVGRDFYTRHTELRLAPLTQDDMVKLWARPDTIGRVAKGDGIVVGFYICGTKGDVARVLEWATLGTKDIEQRGLPEAMAMDLMELTGPKSWWPMKRFSRLESDVRDTHPAALPPETPPKDESWLKRRPLF